MYPYIHSNTSYNREDMELTKTETKVRWKKRGKGSVFSSCSLLSPQRSSELLLSSYRAACAV